LPGLSSTRAALDEIEPIVIAAFVDPRDLAAACSRSVDDSIGSGACAALSNSARA